MNIVLREKFFSVQRFNRYMQASGNHLDRANLLYSANLRLAQAFHPLLGQFEVVLRNSLNNILARHFADTDWIINEKNGFMNDPSLASSRFFLRESVLKSEGRLTRLRIPVTSGKIISDQMFGFWIAFFISHHYSLVRGQPIYVFPNKPSTESRSSLHRRLEEIRIYRNRMNHCEPLCFNGNNIDCAEAAENHRKFFEILSWMDPNLIPYFKSIDKVSIALRIIGRI